MKSKNVRIRVNSMVSDRHVIDRDDDALANTLIELIADIEHLIDETSASDLIGIAASLSLRVVRSNSNEVAMQFITRGILEDISKKSKF